ncbi:hypothetical protein [Bradyrhizobium neotropicale]|uniref:hypothetical protein n=1 Tax=Bradyrhizobium neotropicale TaxID=1497615 RepID=UPI001AD7CDF4|nr:hypothetical protein [Bradyrhizobium neotropicale]MBO4225027.1 hypothetical protein [Bradyrhizobium neotropicale]
MIRILIGLIAAVVVAAAGLLGFNLYVQHRMTSGIEAAFAQVRAAGGKASHGKVTVDMLARTVTVVDIVGESAAQPPARLRIASLTATGVRQPDRARISADSIELADIELATEVTDKVPARVTYKVPRFTVKDYSGPSTPAQLPASESLLDIYRFALQQFTAVAASSVIIPSVTGTINGGAATPDGGEFAYSGVALQDIRDGKVASTKADSFTFTVNTPQAGKRAKLTGTLSNLVAHDFDAAAAGTVLDPGRSNDDSYHRIYRQVSAGPYVLATDQGMRAQIDSITVDDIAVRPSKLQLAAILALMPQPRAGPPTQAQARQIMEKMAGVYEGIRIGNAELRGHTMRTPQGPLKLAAIRANLENGRGQLALEGLDVETPKGPFRFDRLALNSFDIPQLMRFAARANAEPKPTPDEIFGLFRVFEGIEVKGAATPFRDTDKLVNIDTISLGWGQFVGPIPSKAHLVAKLNVPIDATDPAMQPFVTAGIDRAAIDVDLGAGWTEQSGAFVLAPASLEIGNLLKASVHVALANVPRGVFSADPVQAASHAGQIEAGAIELILRDSGCVDLAVAQYARAQNVSREAARGAIIDQIKAFGETIAANPDAAAAVDAVVRFVESPGQTLIIKLTPHGKVPGLQLVQLLKTDPLIALAQFRVEASTGL